MQAYRWFAKHYDAVERDRTGTIRLLKSLLARYHPRARTVLELACGTGAILKPLSRRYSVWGLDLSPEMLALARRKVPAARLSLQDMSRFQLGRRFDVVLCVFDSINHLTRFSDWRRLFRRVHAHLEPGGLFVFDVNTPRKLRRLVRSPPYVKGFGGHHLIMSVTDLGRGVTNWNTRVFERGPGGRTRLLEEDIQEAAFPTGRIRRVLEPRYRLLKTLDPLRRRPTPRSERLYFVCRPRP